VFVSINKVFDKLDQQPKKYVVLIDFDFEHIYKDLVAKNTTDIYNPFNLFVKDKTCFS
jgi:hypothetical protein